ncbi:SDR family NAD(P)-dependent oxidoreductase [Phyllobacterium sp. SB3]|uniref:SDR family NAD(P)-dependent oxidoreductase n=1 Tax=Phyllobacterium sp. SB3 TaxID=3156073 RepID=UPI0032AF0D3B
MELQFDNKVVAITGAGHGFGLVIAEDFAARGAAVYGTLAPGQPAPESISVRFSEVDLTDREAASAWIADIETKTCKSIDILINNAGGVVGRQHEPIEGLSFEDWDAVVNINLDATFTTCRAVARGMKRQGSGRIINISSNAGLRPSLTGVQAYTTSKHAVVGLTKQLAFEFGSHGVTVNCIAPGFFRSNPSSERQWQGYGDAGRAALVERIALKRLGAAKDISSACVFFASELADYVTGQVLSVDGGR